MAIKGKKRSRSRGSQGARRPAQAPRPVASGRRRQKPWYRTPLGLGMAAIFALVAIGLIVWAVVEARERARELEERQEALEQYSDQLREVLQPVGEPVGEMASVAPPLGSKKLNDLADDAGEWTTSLQEVQAGLVQIFPAEELSSVNELFNESLSLYSTAAGTFQRIGGIEDEETRQQIFTQAATVRDTATALFQSAIGVLDQMREEAELGSSAIQPPVSAGAQQNISPTEEAPGSETFEIPSDEGDDGG